MPELRLTTVKDEAGASQGLILDHPNGQRLTMTGSAVTSAGLNSPLAWVKNLGPGTIFMRGDGSPAGVNQAGSYPLYAGQDWPLAADNVLRTISVAGPSGTVVSVIPAKSVAATVVIGTGGAGFTDADVNAAVPVPSTAQNRPDVARLVVILKKIRVALDATVGSVPWGAITGSIAAQADLIAKFAQYALVGHSHARTDGSLFGFGTAAGLNVPAGAVAAANEVVRGDDPRLTPAGVIFPRPESDITGLVTDLGIAKLDPINIPSIVPAVGTIVLEEYAEAAGTVVRLTHRLTSGSMTYKIQIGGVDVTGLASLSPTSVQAQVTATGANTFAVGQRTTMVVLSVSTPGTISGTIKRTLT